jgi:hypothetical protein
VAATVVVTIIPEFLVDQEEAPQITQIWLAAVLPSHLVLVADMVIKVVIQ